MKEFLGAERREYHATYLRLDDDEENLEASQGTLTWYDAREANPKRSEFRFYYQKNPAISSAAAGDLLAIILRKDERVLFVSAPQGSQAELALSELFQNEIGFSFSVFNFSASSDELTFSRRTLLEEIGIEVSAEYGQDYLDAISTKFGGLIFPPTAEFSALARELSGEISAFQSSDEALIAYWETEEAMFRQLEAHLIEERLWSGFEDAEDFLAFSQTIRQRRSSRAGHALENHLSALFDFQGLQYAWGQRTEGNKRPDFLFPSIEAYQDPNVSEHKLMMLGVKTTCKDRWRQVLTEADRIAIKHLLTLQPKISKNQTEEMQAVALQLVIPEPIQNGFTLEQRSWLWSLERFVEVAKSCQQ